MATTPTPATSSSLLALPFEIRLQIWTLLLTPPQALTMRSLFIRDNYRNVFMTQQAKSLSTVVLRICRQITLEALPLLYAIPTWRAGCRLEALASQVGISNFCLIRHLCVDADDLTSIVGSLVADMHEREPSGKGIGTRKSPTVEMKVELESRALMENMMASGAGGPGMLDGGDIDAGSLMPFGAISQRRLRFSSLEILEVDGYQTMALTSRGNRRSRLEALRLCSAAKQILTYHPSLDVLLQRGQDGDGGSDAVDFTMGRVRWRFLRIVGVNCPLREVSEHEVDLFWLEELLKGLVEIDEEDALVRRRERDRLPAWTNAGFLQYPYLETVFEAG